MDRLFVLQEYAEKLGQTPTVMIMAGAKSGNPDFHEVTGLPTQDFLEKAGEKLQGLRSRLIID